MKKQPRLHTGLIAVANATGFGGLAEDKTLEPDWCIFGNELMKGMVVACAQRALHLWPHFLTKAYFLLAKHRRKKAKPSSQIQQTK